MLFLSTTPQNLLVFSFVNLLQPGKIVWFTWPYLNRVRLRWQDHEERITGIAWNYIFFSWEGWQNHLEAFFSLFFFPFSFLLLPLPFIEVLSVGAVPCRGPLFIDLDIL